MFKKVTTSKKTDYKQCSTYQENMPYHTRLQRAHATDLRDNAEFIIAKNGYGKVVPKKALFYL